MAGPKQLPKKILSKMNKRETTKYGRLRKDEAKLFENSDKAQRASTIYSRKLDKIKEPTTAQKKKDQRLINAGFRAMHFAHKKSDELREFKNIMKKKHM